MIERTVDGLHSHLCALLRAEGGSFANLDVLDIGCGTGAWLHRLKELGFQRLVGVDHELPSPVPGLDLRQFDINSGAPDELGKYSIVSCIEVIEHIENIGSLLDIVAECLDRDGVAVFTTPNIESLRARIRALVSGKIPSFDSKSDPTHLCPILHDSLDKMLRKRGLEIVATHQYPSEKRKSLMFGNAVNWMSSLMSVLLPNELYGDNVIYFVKYSDASRG